MPTSRSKILMLLHRGNRSFLSVLRHRHNKWVCVCLSLYCLWPWDKMPEKGTTYPSVCVCPPERGGVHMCICVCVQRGNKKQRRRERSQTGKCPTWGHIWLLTKSQHQQRRIWQKDDTWFNILPALRGITSSLTFIGHLRLWPRTSQIPHVNVFYCSFTPQRGQRWTSATASTVICNTFV